MILSSYLLYYPPAWLTATQVQAVLILYLLSHSTLYFLADDLFDSPYFYAPLLVFDSSSLRRAEFQRHGEYRFLHRLFATLVLSVICNDVRGLLMVTFLAPLLMPTWYFVLPHVYSRNIYLRLPFPFVISLFYGISPKSNEYGVRARQKEEQQGNKRPPRRFAASANGWKCCTKSICRLPRPSIEPRFFRLSWRPR